MGSKRTVPSQWDGVNSKGGASPKLLNAATMTGTTTVNSTPFNVQNLDNIGLMVKWTGSAVGTISVQGTLDATDNTTNWVDLVFDPVLTQPNNNASSTPYLIRLNQIPYPYIRIHYVNASSTGALTVWISGKDLN